MPRKDPTPLADRFFEKQTESSVDFEIVFAAFLSTLVLTYPAPRYPIIGEITAFGLLLVTLVRRIALASPFAPTSYILKKTRPVIEVASTSAVICLIVAGSWSIESLLGIPVSWIFSLSSLVGLAALLIIQELVFQDYAAWWHAKFKQRFEDMESFQALWLIMSVMFLKLSVAESNKSGREQLRERAAESQSMPSPDDPFKFLHREAGKLTVQFLIIVLIFFAVPVGVSYFAFGVAGFFLGISVVLVHDHSCFLYLAYGNPSYEEFRKTGWTIGIWMLLYVIELMVLLPEVQFPF
ncbi:hypothetical protein KTS45_19565 [Halomicroarcula limicola]|uniref:Uncharacterized protein n=1 Tax=Haloarcula limicola TaxID=1429915 RepID=A0A8J7YH69_9EURY|nr:hypothetical protein [Halomicroarcula limicola]MBV0926408.1 hypothetical protein [Halomicroarcula limicola]